MFIYLYDWVDSEIVLKVEFVFGFSLFFCVLY